MIILSILIAEKLEEHGLMARQVLSATQLPNSCQQPLTIVADQLGRPTLPLFDCQCRLAGKFQLSSWPCDETFNSIHPLFNLFFVLQPFRPHSHFALEGCPSFPARNNPARAPIQLQAQASWSLKHHHKLWLRHARALVVHSQHIKRLARLAIFVHNRKHSQPRIHKSLSSSPLILPVLQLQLKQFLSLCQAESTMHQNLKLVPHSPTLNNYSDNPIILGRCAH